MAEHIPGPWVVVENDGAYVKHPDLAMLRIEDRSTTSELVLALIVTDCDLLNRGPAQANARLIAAAPDLLESLILAHVWITEALMKAKHTTSAAHVAAQIHHAIAKTKGDS